VSKTKNPTAVRTNPSSWKDGKLSKLKTLEAERTASNVVPEKTKMAKTSKAHSNLRPSIKKTKMTDEVPQMFKK